jgi:hypothetical protein
MERWRLGETEERPVMPPNGGRVDELVDLSGGTQRSGVAGVERERRLRVCDSDTARERRGMILGFGGGEGRPGRGLYVAPPNGRIQRSRGATSTVLGRGGRVWGGGGWAVSSPGQFSAWYWAAIMPPIFGSCFGPARRARVAAQALKGHRAGPTLSPIHRA